MEPREFITNKTERHLQIEAALQRAYRSARLKAAQTGTCVVNMVDGVMVVEKVLMSDIVGNQSYTADDLANYVNHGVLLKDRELVQPEQTEVQEAML